MRSSSVWRGRPYGHRRDSLSWECERSAYFVRNEATHRCRTGGVAGLHATARLRLGPPALAKHLHEATLHTAFVSRVVVVIMRGIVRQEIMLRLCRQTQGREVSLFGIRRLFCLGSVHRRHRPQALRDERVLAWGLRTLWHIGMVVVSLGD